MKKKKRTFYRWMNIQTTLTDVGHYRITFKMISN